jgi:hypothetical protein
MPKAHLIRPQSCVWKTWQQERRRKPESDLKANRFSIEMLKNSHSIAKGEHKFSLDLHSMFALGNMLKTVFRLY